MLIIEDSYENLVITDRLIIRKMNQKPDLFINVPIVEFARNANAAISTISKFVRRIGFQNYRGFQNYISQSYLLEKEKTYLDLIRQIKRDDNDEKLKKCDFYAIEETIKLLDKTQLENLVRKICQARKIWLIGKNQNWLQTQDLCNILNLVGFNAFFTSNPSSHRFELNNLKTADLVIVIADHYQSQILGEMARSFKNHGVSLAVITATSQFFVNDVDYILNYFAFPPEDGPNFIGNAKIQGFFLNNLIMNHILNLKDKTKEENWSRPLKW